MGRLLRQKSGNLLNPSAQSSAGISRIVARCAAEGYESGMDPLVEDLKGVLTEWRVGGADHGDSSHDASGMSSLTMSEEAD